MHVFQRCGTQWRVGMAGPTGLDYAGVEPVLRMLGPADPADCFARVQQLEFATLAIIADRRGAS